MQTVAESSLDLFSLYLEIFFKHGLFMIKKRDGTF